MEDALAPLSNNSTLGVGEVLILVVMEDALALQEFTCYVGNGSCLNPCCNGRCTRTKKNRVEDPKN